VKILVSVKRVPDPETTIKVNPDGNGIVEAGIKWVVNPFDEIAIEEALRIKEKSGDCEVVLVTIGGSESQEQLRTGLAMGADRAVLVQAEGADPTAVAKLLAKVAEKEQPNLMLMGKQAIDDDSNEVGQMLAQLLGWPQATFISVLKMADDGASAEVTREVDGGLEVDRVKLPAVITADLRLNEPRYASLPGIMKARKKPLEEIDAASLGVDLQPRIVIKSMAPPPERKAGRIVESVDDLVNALRNEAKVL